MTLTFTSCAIRDWRSVMAVFRECFPKIPESEMSYFLRYHGRHVRLLRHGRKVGGFSINNPTHGPEQAWLEMIAVGRSLRGRGLGQRLLEDYEGFVARLGYPRIELAVDADNSRAIALYENNGYQPVSRPGRRLTYAKRIDPVDEHELRYRYRPPGLIRRATTGLLGYVLFRGHQKPH